MEKWEELQLDLDNSKSEEDKVIISIKNNICQDNESYQMRISIGFAQKRQVENGISRMYWTKISLESNFVSIQVIEIQLYFRILKIFSSNF